MKRQLFYNFGWLGATSNILFLNEVKITDFIAARWCNKRTFIDILKKKKEDVI